MTGSRRLRKDALAIWRAGVNAVASDRLVRQHVSIEGRTLRVGVQEYDLTRVGRIAVVGAGKAGAGMAEGLEAALGSALLRRKKVSGWVNVPDDCLRPLASIHLHAARPAGHNEPTDLAVMGTRKILEIVRSLHADDLCICLLSGGGSALLPAPAEGISLQDKQQVTQLLSAAGANIVQLNTVRKQLSAVKGGGLARECRAGHLVTLIISDVLGDPLDVIASGPTVEDRSSPADALRVLEQFDARNAGVGAHVFEMLARTGRTTSPKPVNPDCVISNCVIGNNSVAVDAAGAESLRRGYRHAMVAAHEPESDVNQVGVHLAQMADNMVANDGPNCLISGGEPTVQLVDVAQRGRGGRNQQLVLAGLNYLLSQSKGHPSGVGGRLLLSGGTDGEDGPTDAAGAVADYRLAEAVVRDGLQPAEYLQRNDAYSFFDSVDGLIRTGPTHTNVCDLRVVLVDR